MDTAPLNNNSYIVLKNNTEIVVKKYIKKEYSSTEKKNRDY
jgi:hypothetical protein